MVFQKKVVAPSVAPPVSLAVPIPVSHAAVLADYQNLLEKHNEKYPPSHVEFLPSGSIALDYIFGGGLPLGKVILFTSAPALGKTLVAVSMAKQLLQNQEGIVLYLDSEKALDQSLIDKVVGSENKHRFITHTPPTYEAAEEIIRDYSAVKTRLLLVVFDSVTALQPKSVLEEGSARLGAKSGYEALFCVKMKLQSATGGFGVFYLNQQRANINTTGQGKGPATKAAGGWALMHYVDFNIQMRPNMFIKDAGGNKIGVCASIHSEKNRIVGNRSAHIFLKYGIGISNIATMGSILKHRGLVTQSGSYFKIKCPDLGLGEEKNVQGGSGLDAFVSENFDAISKLVCKPEILGDYFMNFKG